MDVGQVVKGLWYPEMPPMLGDEDIDHYTQRLTGSLGYELCPYDHHRKRQCSIGFHDECSDPRGERCKCPCHQGGSTEETVAAAVLRSAVATIVASSGTEPVMFACRCGQRWRIEPAEPAPAAAVGADPMPVFTIKAKDRFSRSTVMYYHALCLRAGLVEQAAEVALALDEIRAWQDRNRHAVKDPDHKHVPVEPTGGRVAEEQRHPIEWEAWRWE
jgi:hypothetical protein